MSISSLPWLLMFFLILSAGAISDRVLGLGRSKFVARGVIAIAWDLLYLQFQLSLLYVQEIYM